MGPAVKRFLFLEVLERVGAELIVHAPAKVTDLMVDASTHHQLPPQEILHIITRIEKLLKLQFLNRLFMI